MSKDMSQTDVRFDPESLAESIDSHPACNNEFFAHIAKHGLSAGTLRAFIHDYYYWISSFPAILGAAIANDVDPATRYALTQILHSELGSGDPERMHFRLFANLASGLGVRCERVSTEVVRPETKALVHGMKELYGGPDICAALGAQYALERQAFPMITHLARGFKHPSSLRATDYTYIDIHLVEEPEHLSQMNDCLVRCVRTSRDVASARGGAVACLDLIASFWRATWRAINLSAHRPPASLT